MQLIFPTPHDYSYGLYITSSRSHHSTTATLDSTLQQPWAVYHVTEPMSQCNINSALHIIIAVNYISQQPPNLSPAFSKSDTISLPGYGPFNQGLIHMTT